MAVRWKPFGGACLATDFGQEVFCVAERGIYAHLFLYIICWSQVGRFYPPS